MRSKFAALSPNEETTLRLIARGMRNPMGLRERDLRRLQRQDLVVETRTGVELTAAGRERSGAHCGPSPASGGSSSSVSQTPTSHPPDA